MDKQQELNFKKLQCCALLKAALETWDKAHDSLDQEDQEALIKAGDQAVETMERAFKRIRK